MTDTSTKNGTDVSMHEAREATLRWLMGFDSREQVIPEMVSVTTGLSHDRVVGALYDLSNIEGSGLVPIPGRRATYTWKRRDDSPIESHRQTQKILDAEPETPEPKKAKRSARTPLRVRAWVEGLDQPRRFNAREVANALGLDYAPTALALRSMALCGVNGVRQASVRTAQFYFNPDAYIPANSDRVHQERLNLIKAGLVPMEQALQAIPGAIGTIHTQLTTSVGAGNRVSYVNGPSQVGRKGRTMWAHPRWLGKEPLIGPVVASKISGISVEKIRDKMENGELPNTDRRVSPNDMEAFMETLTRDPETKAPEAPAPKKPRRTSKAKAVSKAVREAKATKTVKESTVYRSDPDDMPTVTFRDTDILVIRDADGTSSAWRPA